MGKACGQQHRATKKLQKTLAISIDLSCNNGSLSLNWLVSHGHEQCKNPHLQHAPKLWVWAICLQFSSGFCLSCAYNNNNNNKIIFKYSIYLLWFRILIMLVKLLWRLKSWTTTTEYTRKLSEKSKTKLRFSRHLFLTS